MSAQPPRLNAARIRQDIAEHPVEAWDWLADSWADPDAFLQAVLGQHGHAHGLACESVVGHRVDLVHDLLLRHESSNGMAIESSQGRAVSFVDLAHTVAGRARHFERRGLAAGLTIAFVVADPVVLIEGVLAAWTLGAVVSLIVPRGAAFVRTRLAGLAPDLVASAHPDGPWERDLPPEQVVSAVAVASGPTSSNASFVYDPGQEVARLFSPFASDPAVPVSLTANALLAGLIRDALVLQDLAPGKSIAAASLDLQWHEPVLFAAGLLAGATRKVAAGPNAAERPPEVYEADVVGLTGDECRAAAQGKLDLRRSKRWFTPIADPVDVVEVQTAAQQLLDRKLPGSWTLGCAAAGGTFAWVPRPQQPGILEALPVPGQAFELRDPAAPELLAENAGVLSSQEIDPEATGSFVLGRQQARFFFGGALQPTRGGQTFPRAEIENVARETAGVREAVTVTAYGARPNGGRLILLVFIDPRADWAQLRGGLVASITARLKTQLGAATPSPDSIEVFPLFAPATKGKTDTILCETQYLAGHLSRRAADPMFCDLARLRATLDDLEQEQATV